MSVRVTLNCKVKSDQFDTLLPFLEKNLPNVRGFKGNTRVSVFFDIENSEMLLDEDWLSINDHQAYLAFIESNGVLGELGGFLAGPPAIKYFTRVEI